MRRFPPQSHLVQHFDNQPRARAALHALRVEPFGEHAGSRSNGGDEGSPGKAKGDAPRFGRADVWDSAVAVLPIGYADGYMRGLSNKAHVLIRGKRAPVAGVVCMDLTMCDVTDIPGVSEGDEAVLLGSQGNERITAEELASLAGTIAYEVFCGISARVPRVYVS